MLDFATMAKSYRRQPTNDELPSGLNLTGDAASLGRDFLVGYLLHYCRLAAKLERLGTAPVLHALLELEPDNGEVNFLLAHQYELDGHLHDSLAYYERAASLRPDRPSYTLAAVRLACRLGERHQAMALVGSVIAAYPIMAEAYYERGVIYEVDENWERARRDYDMCTRLEPQNPRYLSCAARVYRMMKLFKAARQCATKALKLDPHYAPAHEELRQIPIFETILDFGREAVGGRL